MLAGARRCVAVPVRGCWVLEGELDLVELPGGAGRNQNWRSSSHVEAATTAARKAKKDLSDETVKAFCTVQVFK